MRSRVPVLVIALLLSHQCACSGQPANQGPGGIQGGGFPGGPGGFPGGPGGFPGGPGGPGGMQRELVAEFDKNKDGWLNDEERSEARKSDKNKGMGGPFGGGPRGPGGPGRRGPSLPEVSPGPKESPSDFKPVADADLFDRSVLRTIFIQFENQDWEKELAEFHGSDVDVPATVEVDGKSYPNVGIRFRGMSSYMMVPEGHKRSLNLSIDMADKDQRLYGAKNINLLNAHEDDSMMSTVLYSLIAREYIPAPRANFVRVVINGEYWGVYCNVEQFDKEFIKSNFGSKKGNRWKVRGNPGADGGLRYVGDDVAAYKQRYLMKSSENDQAWKDLVELCRIIDATPAEQLPDALKPVLDVDGVLKFLALDVALVNNDGYWVRSSDYSIYQDENKIFHLIPHDMNEALHGANGPPGMGPPGMGPGFGPPGGFGPPQGEGRPGEGRPGGRGRGFGPPRMMGGDVHLDPLVGLEDAQKPLRSKLLAVPEFKTRYLEYVKAIAEKSLDWDKIGKEVASFRSLIEKEVARDTRKLGTTEAFLKATSDEKVEATPKDRDLSLRSFFDLRRSFLLNHAAIKEVSSANESAPDGKSKKKD